MLGHGTTDYLVITEKPDVLKCLYCKKADLTGTAPRLSVKHFVALFVIHKQMPF